jgi:hypothetical protein
LRFVHYLFYHVPWPPPSEKGERGTQRRAVGAGNAETRRPSIASSTQENFMPFENDQSEAPAGHAADALEGLLDAHVKTIVQQLIDRAERGDPTAIRLCLERIMPPLRERPVQFELLPLEKPADAAPAIAAIVAGLADGSLSAAEGLELARFVQTCVEILVLAGRGERADGHEERDAEGRTGSLGLPRVIGSAQLPQLRDGEERLRQAA